MIIAARLACGVVKQENHRRWHLTKVIDYTLKAVCIHDVLNTVLTLEKLPCIITLTLTLALTDTQLDYTAIVSHCQAT
jgi:hypothetical protein